MDNTPKYIKMCEKAKRIQNIRQGSDVGDRIDDWWQSGDFIYSKDDEWVFNVCDVRHCAASTGYFDEDNLVWLPRQDQLQEMVWRENAQHTLLDFTNCVGALFDERDKHWLQFTSFEQLWLAFVMHEKYGKHWDNEKEEWINK